MATQRVGSGGEYAGIGRGPFKLDSRLRNILGIGDKVKGMSVSVLAVVLLLALVKITPSSHNLCNSLDGNQKSEMHAIRLAAQFPGQSYRRDWLHAFIDSNICTPHASFFEKFRGWCDDFAMRPD